MTNQIDRLRRWYKGPVPPGRTTPLSLLVIQGTRFCNIKCDYCYLPLRDSKRSLDLTLLEMLIPKLLDSGLISEAGLSIAWHAGEPLVLEADFYRKAFERIREMVPDLKVEHHFQTNGMLLNESYCELIKEFNAHVGLSIDGPQFIHDRRRRTRSGQGTHERAMEGADLLKRNEIPFSVICVLGDDSLNYPNEIYDFFSEIGVKRIGFNIEEIEGYNKDSTLARPDIVSRFKNFYRTIIKRVRADRYQMDVRELSAKAPMIISGLSGGGTTVYSDESNPFSIISMDVDGNICTLSPELVDLVDRHGENFSIGHISALEFQSICKSEKFLRIVKDVGEGVARCRATCSYFDVCGGGAPANKLAENGTFASTETMHCRLTRQALVDVIEEDLAHLLQRRRDERKKRLIPVLAHARRRVSGVIRPLRSHALVSGDLVPGVPIWADFELQDRVSVSAGTCPAEELVRTKKEYKKEAIVPKEPWRPPTEVELSVLTREGADCGPLSFVSLVKLPSSLTTPLLRLGSTLRSTSRDELGETLSGVSLEHISSILARLYAEGETAQLLGIGLNSPDQVTATVDPTDQLRIGLHLDSWSRLPANQRVDAPNRLCVNISPHPRYLLFINIPMSSVLESVRHLPDLGLNSNPTDIGRSFMSKHPRYPVVRLRVDPGEAYLAPTENIIHDGQSVDMGAVDVTLTLLGRFPFRRKA